MPVEREKLEMMSALIASGMVTVANHADDPENTARRSVAIAKKILSTIESELGPDDADQ